VNTIQRIGWDTVVSDMVEVVFGVMVYSVTGLVWTRARGQGRGGDRFLGSREGKGLINGFWRRDSGRGNEGDRDSEVTLLDMVYDQRRRGRSEVSVMESEKGVQVVVFSREKTEGKRKK